MIRINLLPRTTVRTGTSIKNQAIVAGVIVFLSLAGILFTPKFGYFPLGAQITQLDKDIKKAEEELKKVQQYNKQLDEIKKLNRSIEEKLRIIDEIEKKRTGPVWLMDEMTDAVSRFLVRDETTGNESWQYKDDKVFLTNMDVTGNKLSIEGMALNNTYLVAFLNNLKGKSYLFNNVTLFFSDQTSFEGAIVRKFKITADVIMTARPGVVTTTGSVPVEPVGNPATNPATNVAPTTNAPATPTPTNQAPKPK